MFQPLERGRSFRSKQIQFWLNNQVRLIFSSSSNIPWSSSWYSIFKGPYIMTSLQVSPDVSLREKVEFFWNQFDTELAFYTRVAMLRNVNITKDHEIHIIRVWSKEKLYRHYIRQAYSIFLFSETIIQQQQLRWELLQKRLIECHFYFWSDNCVLSALHPHHISAVI